MARDVRVRERRGWWSIAGLRPLGPIDVVTSQGLVVVAAYGLRKLRSSFDGPMINVRRSSDNATMDIGLRGPGDLDLQNFSSFVGAGNGFVTKWYDQSGGGHDATNATPANQPQLVLNATPSGKPALFSSAATVGLTGTIPAATVPLTLSGVASRTGALTAYCNILGLGGGANPPALFYINSPGIAIGNVGLDAITMPGVTDNQFHCVIGVDNGASSSLQVDSATATGTLSSQPGSTQIFPVDFSLIGYVAEAIYYSGALSSRDIAALAANQKAYWGTP